jgi:hypothetical protein
MAPWATNAASSSSSYPSVFSRLSWECVLKIASFSSSAGPPRCQISISSAAAERASNHETKGSANEEREREREREAVARQKPRGVGLQKSLVSKLILRLWPAPTPTEEAFD